MNKEVPNKLRLVEFTIANIPKIVIVYAGEKLTAGLLQKMDSSGGMK